MPFTTRLRDRAKALRREITALYYAYQNPGLPLMPRLVILITLGYALSPIDLIPDFIPVIGYLDDLVIIPALIALSIKLIPADIIEDARTRARREPISLKKRPLFAALFILIWISLVVAAGYGVYRILRK